MKKSLMWIAIGIFVIIWCATAAVAKEKIVWVTHAVIYETTGNGKLFEQFTKDTGIEIEVLTYPTDQLFTKVFTDLVAGGASYDVVNFNDSMFNLDTYRFFEPLKPYMEKYPLPDGGLKDFVPGMVRQYAVPQTDNGTIYGLPNRMAPDILFYRKDLFEKYKQKVPTTWEEFYKVAKALTIKDSSGSTEIYGAVIQGAPNNFGLHDWLGWVTSVGGSVLTPPDWAKPSMNSEPGLRQLKLRKKMIDEGIISRAAVNYAFDDAINAMAQGKAAMIGMYAPYWARLEDPKRSRVAGKIGHAVLPRDESVAHNYYNRGWGVMIPKGSKHKEAAWKFISFYTSLKSQLYAGLKGNAATRQSVFKHPEFQAAVPIANALAQGAPRTTILPNVPNLFPAYEEIGRFLNSALTGEKTPEEALKASDALLQSKLVKK